MRLCAGFSISLALACAGDDGLPLAPVDGGDDTETSGAMTTGSVTGTGLGSSGSETAVLDETASDGDGTTSTDTGMPGTSSSSGEPPAESSSSSGDPGTSTDTGMGSETGSSGTDTGTTGGSSSGGSSTTGEPASVVSVTLGDDQVGFIDQQMPTPVVIQVEDTMGMPIVGVTVDVTAPLGAVADPASGVTDMAGQVVVLARVGRAIGDYDFVVDVEDGAQTVFTASATAPPQDTALTLVNVQKVTGNNLGVPGSGTAAIVGDVQGIAVAADDTVYFTAVTSGDAYVYALDPVGHLTVVAGGGLDTLEECIDPLTADLSDIEDILYDEPNNVLYVVAEYGDGWRVITIDLDTDLLCTFAGGNEDAPAPQYGDGGLATDARLVAPGDISLNAGVLYIADRNLDRIRQVELGVISEFLGTGDCSDRIALTDCQTVGCEMAWDALGNLFIDGRICGTDPGGTTNGIVRVDPATMEMEHIAGQAGGSAAEPVLSFFAELGGLGGLTFDDAGNLYVVEELDHRVRRIDATTWQITTVLNAAATEGQGTDYDLAVDVQLDDPRRIAFTTLGDLVVADTENSAVRLVWQAGDVAPIDATLDLVAGDMQSVTVDEQMSLFITDIVDDMATPLEGLSVHYVADDAGACVRPSDDLTDDSGFSATFGRPGLLPGSYSFRAEYEDIHGTPITGSPVVITADAAAPATGEIITAVNVDHTAGNLGVPGAGSCARVGDVAGVSVASDGGVFFADNASGDGRIRLLEPTGDVIDVAGGGAASVDGVPALDADLSNVRDVLYDEANNRVFVTGTYGGGSSVLRVNLASNPPALFVFAGQPMTLPDDGDNGLATVAHLSNATDMAFDPTNTDAMYVVDSGHNRVRRVESLVIEHVYGVGDDDCTDAIAMANCTDCNLAFDDAGDLYIFGRICGTEPGGSTPGILFLDLDDGAVLSVTHYAGAFGGTLSWPGFDRLAAQFESPGGLLVGSDDNLYFVERDGHRVGMIDTTTGTLSVVAGDGTQGASGDYGLATSARLDSPIRIDERPAGDLVIADFENAAVRLVWDAF